MQITIAVLPIRLFPWHTNDSVMLACHGVDNFKVQLY